MPASTDNKQATAPSFLGLQSYTEAQSNLFFGRDAETDTLTSLVELNTLTIVFGRSGTGKTSLLNAGVFPKLRKSFCLPFRIRLEFNDNSADLVTQIKKVLKEEIDKYGFKVESYPSSETLWEYFHKEPLWKTVTPIIVFDQFEEIFTLAKANPRFASIELPLFWEELSNLIENNIPEKLKEKFLNQKEKIEFNYKKQKAKIVFSFREEYLPEFETITSKIPSLKYSRFRLLPMNGNQAYEVITRTWKDKINETEARHLVSYFTNEPGISDYSLVTVEPSLLSQVCAYIDKERIQNGEGKVSAELLNKYPKEAILRSIYEEAITQANNTIRRDEKDKSNVIKEFVEEKLITTEGFRTRYNLGTSDELIRPGITILVTKYFIREDDDVVELTHDVITPIIKADREDRRNKIALAIARKKARKRMLIILLATIIVAGGIWALALRESSKAIDDRDKAVKDKDIADSLATISKLEKKKTDSLIKYSTDSLEKVFINKLKNKDSSAAIIDRLQKEIVLLKDSLAKRASAGIPIDSTEVNKLVKSLNEEIDILKADTTTKSMTLREKDGRLSAIDIEKRRLEKETTEKSEEIRDLKRNISNKEQNIKENEERIKSLTQQIEQLNFRIADLNREIDRYKLLRHENDSLINEIRKNRKTIDSLMRLVGNVNLIGKIYYQNEGNSQAKPSNVPMYLISKKMNRQLAKYNSVYEINCYEKDLTGKKGIYKTVTDANGNYAFRNIPEGDYLLKICTYYGGFYTVTIADLTKRIERNFNASPPVNFPYSN